MKKEKSLYRRNLGLFFFFLGGNEQKSDQPKPKFKIQNQKLFHQFGEAPFLLRFQPIPEEEMGETRAPFCCYALNADRDIGEETKFAAYVSVPRCFSVCFSECV